MPSILQLQHVGHPSDTVEVLCRELLSCTLHDTLQKQPSFPWQNSCCCAINVQSALTMRWLPKYGSQSLSNHAVPAGSADQFSPAISAFLSWITNLSMTPDTPSATMTYNMTGRVLRIQRQRSFRKHHLNPNSSHELFCTSSSAGSRSHVSRSEAACVQQSIDHRLEARSRPGGNVVSKWDRPLVPLTHHFAAGPDPTLASPHLYLRCLLNKPSCSSFGT